MMKLISSIINIHFNFLQKKFSENHQLSERKFCF